MQIIAGKYKRQPLLTPKKVTIRPTTGQVREALFNICQQEVLDCHFLDLFAGSGACGLEALSRGASHTLFVEKNPHCLQILKKNIAKFNLKSSTTLYPGDVFQFLETGQRQLFDLIFADPPYHEELEGISLAQKTLELIDQGNLLKSTGFFFLEVSSHLSLQCESLKTLSLLSKRHFGKSHLYHFQVV